MSTLAVLAADNEKSARLIAALDLFTRRNLVAEPPADADTMEGLGVGSTNLDRYIRPWINQTFRDPQNRPRLLSGQLKTSATFAAVFGEC